MTPDELQILEARWRLRDITEADLHRVADELLAKGEDHDALISLFSLDRDELRWRGADAFDSLLTAWGGGVMTEQEAAAVLVHDLAARLLNGTITPLEVTSRASAIYIGRHYEHDALRRWYELHDELGYLDRSGRSYLGRDRAAIEADVLDYARSVTPPRRGH
jgi:hypothetical protein